MAYLPQVFPDIELVLVAYLQTLDLPEGTLVSSELLDTYDGSQNFVRVLRIGGSPDWPIVDHCNVEVSCWGPNKAAAGTLRDVVRLNLTHMALAQAGSFPVPCAFRNSVEYRGPLWLDEPGYQNAGRWLFEVMLDIAPVYGTGP